MSNGDDERTRIVPQGTYPCGNAAAVEIRYPGPDERPSYGRYTQAFTVGRGQDCTIRLVAPGVSRRHVEIFPQDGAWWARDIESSSGTLVNGRPIERLPILGTITLELGRAAAPGYGTAACFAPGSGSKSPVSGRGIQALFRYRLRGTGG